MITQRFLPDLTRPGRATLLVVLSSIGFGLVPAFARDLQAAGVPDSVIAFYRYAFSVLVTVSFLPRERAKLRQAMIVLGAGVAMGLGWTAYLWLVQQTSIAAAGVIYMSYPVFAILFAWAFVGTKPGARSWLACAAVLGAALMLVKGSVAGLTPLAVLMALPAPVTFGLSIVAMSAMAPDLAPMERAACALLGAFTGLAPCVLAGDPGALVPASGDVWFTVLGLGLCTSLIPQLMYVAAAPHVGPSKASACGAVELPTMILTGWMLFAEHIGLREIAASALVLSAIALAPSITTGRRKDETDESLAPAGEASAQTG